MSGLVTDLDEVLTEYQDPERDPLWQLARDVLRTLPIKQTATGAGISERTVKRARAGQSVSKKVREKLADYVTRQARGQLRAAGIRPPIDREALLATWKKL
jgi:FixJ family two-component response regulator